MELQSKTINTFTQTPSITQIISYVIIISDIIIFQLCIYFNLDSYQIKITVSVLFYLVTLILIISGFITSYIDPSDPTVKEYISCRKLNKHFQEKDHLYCILCDSYCSKSAKHCRSCKRCVDNFDHHCIWINNCIGKANYKSFFVMIISTFFQLLIFVLAGIFLSVQDNFNKYLGSMIIVWIYIAILGVLIFLDFNLVLLHFYLNYKGITTFEMIQAQRQQAKQKEKELKKKEQQKQKQRIQLQNKQKLKQKIKQSNTQVVEKIFDNKQSKEEVLDKKNEQIQNKTDQKIHFSQKIQEIHSMGQVSDFDEEKKSQSSYKDLKISEFFMKNKSLRFFLNQDNIQYPQKSEIHRKNLSFQN